MVFIVFVRPTKSTDDLLKSLFYKNHNKLEHSSNMSFVDDKPNSYQLLVLKKLEVVLFLL